MGCHTNSFELKEFAALLRDAIEIEKLEAPVKEKGDELSRLWKSLNLLCNRNGQVLKDNDVLTRKFRPSTVRLEKLQEDKQLTRATEQALACLYAILQSFAETNFPRLAGADCYRFLEGPETGTRQENRKQYLRLQRVSHPNQNSTRPKNIATMFTAIYDILSTTKNR